MKLTLRLTLLIGFFFALAPSAFSNSIPPDSTTNVVDKVAAALLVETGRTLYAEGKLKEALIKFRQASVKDPNNWSAPYWISHCHYNMNNYGYALKYALESEVLGGDKVDDEVHYMLGKCYHRLGSLDSAEASYNKALLILPKRRSKELLIEQFIQEVDYARKALANDTKQYTRQRLRGRINSGYDDYNVVIADGGKTLYFTSRRSNTMGGNMNPDDQQYFEDTYRTVYDTDTQEWDSVSNDIGKINSDGFDALNYISPDGLEGIMTLNTTTLNIKKTTKGSDICELKMSNKGTWNTPKIIKNKSINTSYFEGAATVTADGNTMYFVTDRKGDKSSTDIYVVGRDGKAWGEAKPLPMTINTTGRETTPYITPDGRFLFYSSDGLIGMGGLDIYVVENKGNEWGEPINLGPGINSVNNDTHFVFSQEMKKAFVAGYEIVGEKASLDIYEIDMSTYKLPGE